MLVQVMTEEAETAMDFSLELNEEQRQLQDWVHDFAENVIRPAAHEWDEREETPWPILQEAAKVGIYSPQFLGHLTVGPDGADAADRDRGAVLGRRRHRHGDHGHGARRRGDRRQRHAAADRRVGCRSASARADDIKLGAFCVSEPDAGSDVSALKTRAVYDEAKDEWTLNGQKTWISNGGIASVHVVVASVDPTLGTRGQASFVVRPGTPGLRQGVKFKKHGIRASHTAEVFLDDVKRARAVSLLGGKEKLDERLARAREGQRSRACRRRCARSSRRGRRSARWRSAWRARRTSTRWTTRRSGSSSAGRSSRTRRSRSCWRT